MIAPAGTKTGLGRDLMTRVRWLGIEDLRIESVQRLLEGLSEIGQFQIMDAEGILGEEHVKFACYEALRAFAGGQNLAETPVMELLLKAACTSQIRVAISRLGVGPGCRGIVLVGIDVDDDAMERAVSLTGGRASRRPLKVNAKKRRRIIELLGLTEPAEKTLLEEIALSSVR